MKRFGSRTVRRFPPRRIRLMSVGAVHDLQKIYHEVNRRYFDGTICADITWGPSGRRNRVRSSIKMGSYCVEDKLIRVHPSLDRDFVPRFFVEYIVFHEMLHQKHGFSVVDGENRFHTKAFSIEEATFALYEHARHWERENLNRLLEF